MKKVRILKKCPYILSASIVGVVLGSIGLSTGLALNEGNISQSHISNNANNQELNTSEQIDNKEELTKDQEELSKVISSTTYSKEITAKVNFNSSPAGGVSQINYVNGYNKPILSIWVDSNDNVVASAPNPIMIETLNSKPDINSNNFDISVKSYSSSPFSINAQNGYRLNKPTETHLDWIVQNETYLNPYDDPSNNNYASNYVKFTSIGPEPTVLGSVKSGYAEVKIRIKLPKLPPENRPGMGDIQGDTYFGPNIIDSQKGNTYSNYLGIKNQRESGQLDNIIVDDNIVFTKYAGKQAIYRNDPNCNTRYETVYSSLASTDLVTASQYLDNISSLIVNAYGVYHDARNPENNRSITPRIYGYADDANGTLSIVTFNPYIIQDGRVSYEPPIIKTISGFKKDENAAGSKKVVVDSSQINFINHTDNKKFSVSSTTSKSPKFNFDFGLSPLSLFDFSIQGQNIVIEPKSSISTSKLFLNDFFTDTSLFDWDSLLKDNGGTFTKYNNAKSRFLNQDSDYNTYFNEFSYGKGYAQLLTSINGSDLSNFALANVFDPQYTASYEGPWIINPASINKTENFSAGYLNYFAYLKYLNIFDNISNNFNQKISLNTLNENNKIIQLKKIFASALPKLKNNTSFNDYFSSISNFNTIKNETNTSNVQKYLVNDNLIFYENGPIIMKSSDASANIDLPYLIDPTSVFAWDDKKGTSNLSFESNSIFSSKDNFDYNMQLLENNSEEFGKTTFAIDSSNNAGLGDISTITPSEFISNKNNYSNLTINAYNSLIANDENSTIRLIANDKAGELTVEVVPFVVTDISNEFKNYRIDSLEKFKKMNSVQLANLLNSSVKSNVNNEYVYTFKINGFKTSDNIGNPGDVPNEEQHILESFPTQAFTTSSIIGTDLEANFDKFKNEPRKYKKFESFFVAQAIQNLKNEGLIYFNNPSNSSNSNLLTGDGTLDEQTFNEIISRFSLFKVDKYNLYTYDIWFRPYTLKDINETPNYEEVKIRIDISTTGQVYNSWVANDYISTGLSKAYKKLGITDPIETGVVSEVDFVNNFKNLIIEDKNNVDSSILRYYQNGEYNNNPNNPIPDPLKIPIKKQDGVETLYNIYPKNTAPIIFSYNNNYGFEYDELGHQISKNYKNSIQDIGNWSFKLSGSSVINSGIITFEYTPLIWMEDGKFIVDGIGTKKITFGDVIVKKGLTTSLSDDKLTAYDTTQTPKQVYDGIKTGSGVIYDTYLKKIESLITNKLPLSSNSTIKGTTEVKIEIPSKYDWVVGSPINPDTAEAWKQAQRDGCIQVEVKIKGDYFNNSNAPIHTNEWISLGFVNIVNLKKAKTTRFVDNFNIIDIASFNLASNLSEYFWLQTESLSNAGIAWASINQIYKNNISFEDYINKGMIIDGYQNGNASENTRVQFKTGSISIDSLSNATGTLEIEKGDAKYVGKYYDQYGRESAAPTNGITNEQKITISGFQQVEDDATIVSPASGEITIPSLIGQDISSIDEDKIRDILISNNIIKNFPSIKYGVLGTNKTDKDLIKIQITNRDVINGKLTFHYEVESLITDTYRDANGLSRKIIEIKGLNPKFTTSISGDLTITDLQQANSSKSTQIVPTGAYTELFANEIATVMFEKNNIDLNTWYTDSNPYIKKLIDIIGEYNLILNLPPNFKSSNVQISILSVDNTTGQIEVQIRLDYYWYFENNKLNLYNNPGQYQDLPNTANTKTLLGGFRTISGITDIKDDVKNNGINISSSLKPSNINDVTEWTKIIYNLLPSIFDNLPLLSSNTTIDENLPTINISDLNITIVTTTTSEVTVRIKLKSFFRLSNKYNTEVWNKSGTVVEVEHDYGTIKIKGFDGTGDTNFVSDIFLTPDDHAFFNKLASSIAENDIYKVSLIQIILERGITGQLPPTLNVSNISINSFSEVNNINGTLKVEVSLNNYYANGQEVKPDQAQLKEASIVIHGFKQVKPTRLESQYNGTLNANINSKYSYEFSFDDIRQIVFDSLITNVPNDFTIDDISIKEGSVEYDNKLGSLSFIPVIKNYFDKNGVLKSSPTESFGSVMIYGFKTLSLYTTIDESRYVDESYRNLLAISMLDYANIDNLTATDKLKQYIIDNMINNGPNISLDDIDVNGINVDNITGKIEATVSLKKYIDKNYVIINDSRKPLFQQITITGFKQVSQTSIKNKIFIADSNFLNNTPVGAEQYKNQQHQQLLDLIYQNIENKWTAVGDSFTKADFGIYKVVADNIRGEIRLQVGFKKYIDNKGQYIVTKIGEYPYLTDVVISGFKQIKSSAIENKWTIASVENIYANEFLNLTDSTGTTNLFDIEIKKIIFENLLINPTDETSVNDLEILESSANNATGEIIVKVKWFKNFYDYNGNKIQGTGGGEIIQTIRFDGFKQLSAPTSIKQDINIDGTALASAKNKLPSEYSKVSNPETPQNINNIKDIIIANLINAPQKYDNASHDFKTLITRDDIEIIYKTMSDNDEYLGVVNNYAGTLNIEFTLKKYYNNSFVYVDADNEDYQPIKLNTTLRTFRKTDKEPTTIKSRLDFSTTSNDFNYIDQNAWNYIPEAASIRQLAPLEVTVNDNLIYVLLKAGVFRNWQPLMQVLHLSNGYTEEEYHTALKNADAATLLGLKRQIKISITDASQPTSVQLQISLLTWVSASDGIEVTGTFGSPMYIELTGLTKIEQTMLNGENFTGTTKQALSNYKQGTAYNKINVYDLTDNDISVIIQSELDKIVEKGRTTVVKKISEAKLFEVSNFNKYFKIEKIERNGINGSITLKLILSSYYTRNSLDITNTIDVGIEQNKVVQSTIILSGFAETNPTEINKFVELNLKNISPIDIFETPQQLIQIIIDNKDKFFKYLPETALLNLDDCIHIQVTDFNNVSGTITANISLSTYFDEFGQLVNNDGKLKTAKVNILGFKQSNATSVINELSIEQLGFSNLYLEKVSDPNVLSMLKTALISKQNLFASGTTGGIRIWEWLPNDNNRINPDDFELSIDEKSKNFLSGTVSLNIVMNRYYNESGILVTNSPKTFRTTLTGFNNISGETIVSKEGQEDGNGVSVAKLDISRYTVKDLTNDSDIFFYSNLLWSNLTDEVLKNMFTNLPINATVNNIINLEIIKDAPNSEKDGILYVNIKLNNWFKKENNLGVEQCYNESPAFRVKLSGFQKMDATKTNTKEIDISNYLGNYDLATINSNILSPILNQEEIKKQILINPWISTVDGSIKTKIIVEALDETNHWNNGPEGKMKLNVRLRDFYQLDSNGTIIANSSTLGSKDSYEINLVGFKKLPVTELSKNPVISMVNQDGKASEFAEKREQVIELLKTKRTDLFTKSGANSVNIHDIVDPNITDVDQYLKDPYKTNKIYVNDINGEIKLKMIYNGGYNQNAELNEEYMLSDVVTITNFIPDLNTTWKEPLPPEEQQDKLWYLKSIVESNDEYTLTIYDNRLKNFEANDILPIDSAEYFVRDCIVSTVNQNLEFSQDGIWNRSQEKGYVWTYINVYNWKQKEIGKNNNFDKNSVTVSTKTKRVKLVVEGYKTSNLKQTQTTLIIVLSLTGGIVLFTILLLTIIFIKRRAII